MRSYLFLMLCLYMGGKALLAQTALQPRNIAATNWSFEENKGQVTGNDASGVKYFFHSEGTSIFLLSNRMAYQFTKVHFPDGYKIPSKHSSKDEWDQFHTWQSLVQTETYRMDIEWVGANPNAKVTVEGDSKDYVNYYNRQVLGIRSYKRIIYHEFYPHIDWIVYQLEDGSLKYDFLVKPGGNPAQIRMRMHWVEEVVLNRDGGFSLNNQLGTITEKFPVSLQGNQKIETRFVKKGDELYFEIGEYDPRKPLTIDPNLLWATYFGGGDIDYAYGCTTDPMGNVYLMGATASLFNIAAGGHQMTFGGGITDVFIAKYDAGGLRLWATYYGGLLEEYAMEGSADSLGNLYVAGHAVSTNGIASGGHQNVHGGDFDAFLLKFDANGTRIWGTYYGGPGGETGIGCAVDPQGNVYLSGYTDSILPILPGGHQTVRGGGDDSFLAKFAGNGTLLWDTYYGDIGSDGAVRCATDPFGNVFIAGSTTYSTNMAAGGHQNTSGGGTDGFLVKFGGNGTRQWATYYGGSGSDHAYDVVADRMGNVFLAGSTLSTTNISQSGHQNTKSGNTDGYLVKFNGAGNRIWGTYYGGSGFDQGYYCGVNDSGYVFLSGTTYSTFGIAAGGFQNTLAGINDAFLAKFDPTGVRQWGTYFGGPQQDVGVSGAVDSQGGIYIAGGTQSASNIAYLGFQNVFGGGIQDAYLAKFPSNMCPPSTGFLTQTGCESITVNGQTFTTSGFHNQILTNSQGCDSILTLDLNILQATTSTQTAIDCGSYTWPVSGQTYSNSGVYTAVLTNSVGCDSVITLNLTVNKPSTTTHTVGSCSPYTWPTNGQTYAASGSYSVVLTNSVGCDSTVTLNLTINQPSSGTQTASACGSYTWAANGQTYTASGSYSAVLTNSVGCDSTVILNLTVNQVNTGVTQTGQVLTANGSGTFQWVDCNNAFAAIPGATGSVFVPVQSGVYAVVVSQSGCTDTSACFAVIGTGVEEKIGEERTLALWPNPANNTVHAAWLADASGVGTWEIWNVLGERMINMPVLVQKGENVVDISVSALPNANYWVIYRTGEATYIQSLAVQR